MLLQSVIEKLALLPVELHGLRVSRIFAVQTSLQNASRIPAMKMAVQLLFERAERQIHHINLAQLPLSVRELKRVTSKWQFPIKALKNFQIEKTAPSVEVVDLNTQSVPL